MHGKPLENLLAQFLHKRNRSSVSAGNAADHCHIPFIGQAFIQRGQSPPSQSPQFHRENRRFGSEKSGFQKAEWPVKAPGRPSTGLYPLFRDIYPWAAKGLEKGRFSRCIISKQWNWTILDNSRQIMTNHDTNCGLKQRGQTPITEIKLSISSSPSPCRTGLQFQCNATKKMFLIIPNAVILINENRCRYKSPQGQRLKTYTAYNNVSWYNWITSQYISCYSITRNCIRIILTDMTHRSCIQF